MGSRVLLCLCLFCGGAVAAERPWLVLGDSLSAAYNMPESEGWVALLQGRLAESTATPPKVINASVSGETTAGGLGRLPVLLEAHAPAALVIALGGNDGLRGLPPAQIRQNLERMVELGEAAGAQVVLIGIEMPPNYGQAYRQRFREVYTGVARAHGVPLLPFFLDGVALEPGMMQGDGIHPTPAAQARMLDNVWPLLSALLDVDPG